MNRENPQITAAAAAAIAVFAVSGPVGPFGATVYGQQAEDQTGAPERVGTDEDNSAVRTRKMLSIPELTERVRQQVSRGIRHGIERHGDNNQLDARDTYGGDTERYVNAPHRRYPLGRRLTSDPVHA